MEKQKMMDTIERIIDKTKKIEDNHCAQVLELIDELQAYLADLKRDNNK